MLKSILFFSAILWIVLAPVPSRVHAAQEGAAKAAPHGKVSPEAMAKAQKVYNVDCALCHGESGNGQSDLAKGMGLKLGDWTKPETLAGRSDDDLFQQIRKGKNQMPAESESRASDEEVRNLIALIRKMAAAPAGQHAAH